MFWQINCFSQRYSYYICRIHGTKPEKCRDFPISKRHAKDNGWYGFLSLPFNTKIAEHFVWSGYLPDFSPGLLRCWFKILLVPRSFKGGKNFERQIILKKSHFRWCIPYNRCQMGWNSIPYSIKNKTPHPFVAIKLDYAIGFDQTDGWGGWA